MKGWLKRLRGALGIGVLGALAFHLIGWVVVGAEALLAGQWPSISTVSRMTTFTLSVGGFVGLLTAGAIALGAGKARLITKKRAFLIGLPLGVVGGVALSLGADLTVSAIVVNAATFALGTGALGAGAIAIAEASDKGRLPETTSRGELAGDA